MVCTTSCCLLLLQVLKLQESPDAVPKGELPRHMQLYCDRYLTDKVVPGNRVTVMGVYSIKKVAFKSSKVPCAPWCVFWGSLRVRTECA